VKFYELVKVPLPGFGRVEWVDASENPLSGMDYATITTNHTYQISPFFSGFHPSTRHQVALRLQLEVPGSNLGPRDAGLHSPTEAPNKKRSKPWTATLIHLPASVAGKIWEASGKGGPILMGSWRLIWS